MNCKRSFGLIGKTTSIAAGKVSAIFLHLARLATRSGLQREKNSRILSRQSENTGRPAEWHFAVAGHQLVRECNRRCNAAYPVAIHDKTDYLYTGKELQQLFGIDWSDSFARFQTTSGVFISPDPLAEKYYSLSPYNYCAEDPVNLVSVKSGKGHSIKGAYIESDEFDKMNSYAKQRLADNDNPERQVYSLTNNNCSTFAADVISSDEEVKEKLPLIQLPVPNLFIIQLRMLFEPVN